MEDGMYRVEVFGSLSMKEWEPGVPMTSNRLRFFSVSLLDVHVVQKYLALM